MKYQVHIDSKGYPSKPKNVSIVSNSTVKQIVSVTPQELAGALSEGKTVVLATMKGTKRSNLEMVQQQVMMLDFDNEDKDKNKTTGTDYVTIEQLLQDRFIQDHAAFIYKSFSYKPEHEKFRVAFFLSEAITDYIQVGQAYAWLMEKYPQADQKTKDAARLFYGGSSFPIEVNYSNVLAIPAEAFHEEAKPNHKPLKTDAVPTNKAVSPVDTETKVASLIRSGKKKEVKALLSRYSAKVTSKTSAMNYVKTLNMKDVFGERESVFFDYFHHETNPSAGMYQLSGTNIWIYQCHSSSNDWKGDILRVVSRLLGVTYMQGLDYLIDVMDIKIVDTDEVRDFKDNVDATIHRFLSPDFKEFYPSAHGRFNRYRTELVTLLTVFKENNRVDDEGNLQNISFHSIRTLAKMILGGAHKDAQMKRIINLASYTNWITKLGEKEIPEKLLKDIKKHQAEKGYENASSVYRVANFSDSFFDELEEQCEQMKHNGFTMAGLNYEYVLRSDGQERANEIFPQKANAELHKNADKRVMAVHEIVNTMIQENGYAVIEDVKKALKRRFKSKTLTDIVFNRSVTEMLDLYDLKKISLNKELKVKFDLTKKYKPTSSPKILMPDD
jgi:hypothetical protein